MKTLFAAAAMSAAILFAPQMALAQQNAATPTIVIDGKFQKDWNKGSKMERDGLADLTEAQRDLAEYNRELADAQDEQKNSRERAENSARTFRQLVAQRTDFREAEEAADWADKVDEAASDWAKYADRTNDNSDDLEDALERRDKAQKAVEKAQSKIDSGRAMMASAERRSAGANR